HEHEHEQKPKLPVSRVAAKQRTVEGSSVLMAGYAEPAKRQGGRPLPPPGNRGPPLSKGPLPPVDREKVFFLFSPVDMSSVASGFHQVGLLQIGGHHSKEEFQIRGKEPKDEVQIYTWMDATLRELTDLVKEVAPAARRRDALLSFAFAYPDRNGRFVVREVGKTYSNRVGKLDDNKALGEIGFAIGDYLDVAIQ
ncbi:unnamed protein product, partial [Linum tenue]